jgi:H+/Cl- antiporter ClcA
MLALLAMAVVVGAACAFFLWSLDAVTRVFFANSWLLFLLPVAGAAVGWIYQKFGKSAERGNNLIIDEIHQPGAGVPLRMAPLVLIGTLFTHLFGGSAGREGTAVQMGGSIAGGFCRKLRLNSRETSLVLMGGVAAGFGAVFGTPIAGAIFAMEVLTLGRIRFRAILPCMLAAFVGDRTCVAFGIAHSHYRVAEVDGLWGWAFLLKVAFASVVFGAVSRLFAEASHGLGAFLKARISSDVARPALGGILVIGLFFVAGTPDYLGLGVLGRNEHSITISSFFSSSEVLPWSWIWKFAFTVVTLSAGFKGGEVTPLFFIGAALGNAMSGVLGGPSDFYAALGFVAIFAGATKTPFACTAMGVELFGPTLGAHVALACFIAFFASGKTGIYRAQRLP